jgi:isopentenyl-diphosphate delta-isomerase
MAMPAPTRTSLIDVVSDDDRAVTTIKRGEVLERGVNFRTAHIFIVNGQGDLLLQQLAESRERHPLRWGSSVAAYLHAGETYKEAAIRRLREELGLSLALRFVGKIHMRDVNSLKFVSLFVGYDGEVAILEPEHIAELAYWPIDKVNQAIDVEPERFTPTFRRLYEAFGDRLS